MAEEPRIVAWPVYRSMPRNGRRFWTCPGCGRFMLLTGAQVNARKRLCTTSCPGREVTQHKSAARGDDNEGKGNG